MKLVCTLSFALITLLSVAQNNAVTNTAFFEGEPYLAVNPNNSQQLTAAWMSPQLGQNIVIKTSTSTNGGTTWTTPVWLAHEVSGNTSADVSLQYASNGELFICYIDYNSSTFATGQIMVRKSTNNGVSWGPAVEATSIADCPNKLCLDRPWMAIDRSGGPNNGAIYVTSMNADQPTLITPPYNPYLSVSTDGGASFAPPRFIDTLGYYAGNTITQPMPSPTVDANGTFYAAYPSYDVGQSPFAHIYLAESANAGTTIDHSNAYTVLIPGSSNSLAKKGSLLIADPSAPKHLAMLFVGDPNGDGGDILFMETFDAITWSSPTQLNEDPTGRLQDLVWANFNEDGDLAVCWRDRRNASSSGYQTETEIYGTIRFKDSVNFEPNFPVSSQQVAHAAILEGSGNDFMNVQFVGDTLYSIWGDVRTGTLNIFINRMDVTNGTSSISEIAQETNNLTIYPNPAISEITIDHFEDYKDLKLLDAHGRFIRSIDASTLTINDLSPGNYFIQFSLNGKNFMASFLKSQP